jgi:hypothetical protein
MTAVKNMVKRDKKVRKSAIMEELSTLPIAAEVITWKVNPGVTITYSALTQALTDAQLDPAVAREILPENAFTRAYNKLAEDGIIDVLKRSGDIIKFQLSQKTIEKIVTNKKTGEYEEEYLYATKDKIYLNRKTGKVSCKDQALQKKAQQELDAAIINRTTSDVTLVIQNSFKKYSENNPTADIHSLRDAGGVYLVVCEHLSFVDKIETFLSKIGGRLTRLPVPKGTARGDLAIKDAVSDGLLGMIDQLDSKINGFGLDTREATLERTAIEIKTMRTKIEAYAHYLADMREVALKKLNESKALLVQRVSGLAAERLTAPRDPNKKNPGVIQVMLQMLRQATAEKPITKEDILKKLTELFPDRDPKAMMSTLQSQIPSGLRIEKSIEVSKSNSGYWIEQPPTLGNEEDE